MTIRYRSEPKPIKAKSAFLYDEEGASRYVFYFDSVYDDPSSGTRADGNNDCRNNRCIGMHKCTLVKFRHNRDDK